VRFNLPDEQVTNLHLCREFGWTPNQLNQQRARDIAKFVVLLNEMTADENEADEFSNPATTIVIDDE